MAKRVIIVKLDHLAEIYKDLVALLEQMINMWTVNDPVTKEEAKAACVLALSLNEAWGRVGQGEADCVVFVSGTQIKAARNFKKARPDLKVIIVLDGQLPDYNPKDGIILIEKGPNPNSALREKILDG